MHSAQREFACPDPSCAAIRGKLDISDAGLSVGPHQLSIFFGLHSTLPSFAARAHFEQM